jgi:putative oxidoreductase
MTTTERVQSLRLQLQKTKDDARTRDVALLVARIALAWVFIYHGGSTLWGWFHGPTIHEQAVYFSTVGHLHPATFFVVLAGIIEFFGGIAVLLGVFGRLAGLALVGDMVIAMITITFRNGVIGSGGSGYELNVALIGAAFVIALLGTGRFSLDALASRKTMPISSN